MHAEALCRRCLGLSTKDAKQFKVRFVGKRHAYRQRSFHRPFLCGFDGYIRVSVRLVIQLYGEFARSHLLGTVGKTCYIGVSSPEIAFLQDGMSAYNDFIMPVQKKRTLVLMRDVSVQEEPFS